MQYENLMYRVQLNQLQEQAKQMGILNAEDEETKDESEIAGKPTTKDENEKDQD